MADTRRLAGIKCNQCGYVNPSPFGITPGPGSFGNVMNCLGCGLRAIPANFENVVEIDVPPPSPPLELLDNQYKFIRAANIRRDWRDLVPADHELAIREVVASFARNMDRVSAIITFPVYLVGRAIVLEDAYAEAARRQRPTEPLSSHAPTTEQAQEVLDLIVSRFEMGALYAWRGRRAIDLLIDSTPDPSIGITPLLAAMIIGAWTAFESLATDLWEASVNARVQLAINVVKNDFNFPVAMLAKPGFDIRKSMGTLLQMKSRFDFGKRDGIKEAFEAAFGKDDPVLKEIFCDDLKWLSTVRNAIIHDAGIADEKTAKQLNGHGKLGSLAVGQEIPLDGELVASLVDVADSLGMKLIELVNGYLMRNAEQAAEPAEPPTDT